ncbi:hypothetical protein H310_08152 [Aphanomyces invadans]|uniref:G-protein coupled receptors family 1 profile domain-containing protein n=1 Tax=Aphanomyces invadans TaxID=157072 RepID=A0A024TZT8_9STRA|nr:hypothetical protein H310_08152 [Aphanomyces invadans]ETV99474.1 hypothetical protein H310_08152 [Aphanomyces invadans]|eukprot:XP_008872030.1 hypothetical protein H310_08152 [Aphanomyces invadans]
MATADRVDWQKWKQNGSSWTSNKTMISSLTRMRHYENQNTHPAMLFADCMVLCLSVSMTLTACATVFRWATVRKSPNHGTLFMMFLCLGLWSMAKLVLVLLVDTYSDLWIGRQSIMYATMVSELFFNATSLWCMFATYEFQRWVWRRRQHARFVLLRYHIVVLAVCVAHAVSLVVVDVQNPPKYKDGWRRQNTTADGLRWTENGTKVPQRTPWKPPPTLDLMEYSFWAVYSIRWAAVLYIVVVGAVFSLRTERRHTQNQTHARRWKTSRVFVLVLLVLNTPYLVFEPLFDFDVLDKTTLLLMFSLSKTASYLSGVGMVNLLGLYLIDFDTLYTVKDAPVPRIPPGFVVFDNSLHDKPTFVATRC